jgi:hypothetical protein
MGPQGIKLLMASFNGFATNSILYCVSLRCQNNDNLLALLNSRNVYATYENNNNFMRIKTLNIVQIIIDNDLDIIYLLLNTITDFHFYMFVALIFRFANANTIDYIFNIEKKIKPKHLFKDIIYRIKSSPFLLAMERDDDSVEIIDKISNYARIGVLFEQAPFPYEIAIALKHSANCNNNNIFRYIFVLCTKSGADLSAYRLYCNVIRTILRKENRELIDFLIQEKQWDTNIMINKFDYFDGTKIVCILIEYEQQGKISIDHPNWEKIKNDFISQS